MALKTAFITNYGGLKCILQILQVLIPPNMSDFSPRQATLLLPGMIIESALFGKPGVGVLSLNSILTDRFLCLSRYVDPTHHRSRDYPLV